MITIRRQIDIKLINTFDLNINLIEYILKFNSFIKV